MNHLPRQLSTGEMQRAAIARALANNPQLIIADEPTGELDTQTGEEIVNLLYGVCSERNISMVVATHDQNIA